MPRRTVDLAVISDLHLGTRHCRAEQLIAYLETIDPRRLILDGDVVDLWRMGRRWPTAHGEVIRLLLAFAEEGVQVDLVSGNHDGALRRYAPFAFGRIQVQDHVVLEAGGERILVIHGDVADLVAPAHPVLRRAGSIAYDLLMDLSSGVNAIRRQFAARPISLVGAFKEGLPWAAAHIARYERTCASLAWEAGCDSVICGHMHLPRLRGIEVGGRTIAYRNCGDWVEHGTALEFADGDWRLWSATAPIAGASVIEDPAWAPDLATTM